MNILCRQLYILYPLSVYYKKKEHLAVTYRNRAHFLRNCYVYNTRTQGPKMPLSSTKVSISDQRFKTFFVSTIDQS